MVIFTITNASIIIITIIENGIIEFKALQEAWNWCVNGNEKRWKIIIK
jgi:hypothetical protein